MNELKLGRVLRQVLLASAPLPVAMWTIACGGTATVEPEAAGSTSAGAAGSAGAGIGGAGVAGATMGGGGTTGDSAGSTGTGGACAAQVALCGSSNAALLPRSCVSSATVGVLPLNECEHLCTPGAIRSCAVSAVTVDSVTLTCTGICATGRRPAGLELSVLDGSGPGDHFAEAARLEAASITAFRIMQDELRALGAPKFLIRGARRAARDEVRHTRATRALARRFGGKPRSMQVEPMRRRSVEAIAIENIVEGCVRETYGALLATHQAQHAQDPIVRAEMQRIARDETRHAALSWRVARWLETRLEPAAKRNVAAARRAAVLELKTSAAQPICPGFAELIGLPRSTEAVRIVEALERTLWS